MMTIKERIAVLETKVDDLDKKVDEGFNNIEGKIDEIVCNMDKKYASKVTENIVFGMMGAIALSVLYYILKHVGISI